MGKFLRISHEFLSYINNDPEEAVKDFRLRIEQYEKEYQPLDDSDSSLSKCSLIVPRPFLFYRDFSIRIDGVVSLKIHILCVVKYSNMNHFFVTRYLHKDSSDFIVTTYMYLGRYV